LWLKIDNCPGYAQWQQVATKWFVYGPIAVTEHRPYINYWFCCQTYSMLKLLQWLWVMQTIWAKY